MSTHSAAHSVRFNAHLHAPALHDAPAGQVTPQAPQLRTSELVFAQSPPHATVGATQWTTHVVLELTQAPLHCTCPDGQAHVPAEHCSPPGQGRAHPPQLGVLVSVSTHA